jgi:hypothetical protein
VILEIRKSEEGDILILRLPKVTSKLAKIYVLLKIFGIRNQNTESFKEECSSKYLKR